VAVTSERDDQELRARIMQLEDLEAIRALKARYCLYCDGGWPEQGGDPSWARGRPFHGRRDLGGARIAQS
jgi:hypothetical protein